MSIYRWITKIEKKENTSIKKEGFNEQNENKRCFSPFIFRYKKEEELTGHKQMRTFSHEVNRREGHKETINNGGLSFSEDPFLSITSGSPNSSYVQRMKKQLAKSRRSKQRPGTFQIPTRSKSRNSRTAKPKRRETEKLKVNAQASK